MRFLLPALLALLGGVLAYQLPMHVRLPVGELGDQLFLVSSEAQRAVQIEQGQWYADELSPEGRSRWSRERGTLTLPGLGSGSPAQLTIHAAGWPADVAREDPKQPTVEVWAGAAKLGSFVPTPEMAAYRFDVPAEARISSDLALTLESSATFTDTLQSRDGRPKGIRLDGVELRGGGWGTVPDGRVLGGLLGATLLATALGRGVSRRDWLALLPGIGAALLGVTLLLLARPWLAALLPAVLVVLLLLLALVHWRSILGLARGIAWRLHEQRWLDGLVVAAVLLGCGMLALSLWPAASEGPAIRPFQTTSDRIFEVLLRLSLASMVVLAVAASVTVLPDWVLLLRRKLLTGRTSAVLLGLMAGVWLGYEAWLITVLPFVGHADYADNVVVARNLLRGRGYVVDYVSQFYTLVPGGSVTRPQETWPLLQPLLMLPAMALLGPTPLAARLPNVVFLTALTLLLYHIGATIWDRRVGLLAAVLTLTNILFFRLAIYATSDLALVVWSMAAFWLVFRGVEEQGASARRGLQAVVRSRWLWAGVFTGLMILQKPSAAIFVIGMGLWVLGMISWRARESLNGATLRRLAKAWLPRLLLWVGVTVLVVSPYLVRNLLVFGRPFFSTEAYDAWILYFRGTRGEAWEDIYKVYPRELGGPGLPERSWILQWGWDLTLGKIWQQAADAWSFFAPPKGTLLSYGDREQYPNGIVSTWLMLLGLLVLGPRQRRIVGLVASALVLYTAFLVLYWHTHDEPRYFVPFVPWLALLAAWGACWLFDRIAVVGRGRWAGLGGLLVSVMLVLAIQPHWLSIDRFLDRQGCVPASCGYWGRDWEAELDAFRWIRENTPPDAVVMTRVPWQLNYHADRPAMMIPNADRAMIMRLARYYGADYLVVNAISTSLPESVGGLKDLAQGQPVAGWEQVYAVEDKFNGATVRVYRIPVDYEGAETIAAGDSASR